MARGLAAYDAKRDFDRTKEPRGKKGPAGGNSFVVQKHAARRLHYDFRLEMDGALKSWAVTRGPSLVPGEKRLAVHVEDHPLDYGSFEGVIPKGQYGGGTVIVWDRGTWTPEGDPHVGYKKGHLNFRLDGKKLRGNWHLVRMAKRRGEKHENWLLIKSDDEAARRPGDPDILEEAQASVISKRTIESMANNEDAAVWDSKLGKLTKRSAKDPAPIGTTRGSNGGRREKACARTAQKRAHDAAKTSALPPPVRSRRRTPDFIEPALAKLADVPPDGGQWVHEIKFDGYRIQPHLSKGDVRLMTRKGLDWTGRFKPIAAALGAIARHDAILDGEIVVEGAKGPSDFSGLQAALREGRDELFVCYLFDLIWLDGRDLRPQPLHERKAFLAELLRSAGQGPVRLSEDFAERGSTMLRHACQLGFEGIISKLRDAAYRSGRTGDWIKTKCAGRQELVIGGFTPSSAVQSAIGSLLLGYYDKGKLVYAGRVGTGFSSDVARDLYKRLKPLKRASSPFDVIPADERRKDATWTEPKLVAEIEFRAWTADQILRHAAFKGLRDDKDPREIVRERAEMRPAEAKKMSDVALTHPDRVYWPDVGLTKQGLADCYADIWTWIEPHVVRRPLALVRCPDGISGQCFFQKHSWAGIDRSIKHAKDPDGGEELLFIEDLRGLLNLVQAGVLEIHPWGSTMEALEKPERLIFDLDPGPGVTWPGVIEAARDARRRLKAHDLESFVKTTGGKGLHVVVPLKPAADWETAKTFARAIAEEMAAADPARYVATMAKRLRNGRVFVDYLRNGKGATAVAAYSTRARANAPVSTPLAWEELSPDIGPNHFTVANIRRRLDHLKRDPWRDFDKMRRALPASGAGGKRRKR